MSGAQPSAEALPPAATGPVVNARGACDNIADGTSVDQISSIESYIEPDRPLLEAASRRDTANEATGIDADDKIEVLPVLLNGGYVDGASRAHSTGTLS